MWDLNFFNVAQFFTQWSKVYSHKQRFYFTGLLLSIELLTKKHTVQELLIFLFQDAIGLAPHSHLDLETSSSGAPSGLFE